MHIVSYILPFCLSVECSFLLILLHPRWLTTIKLFCLTLPGKDESRSELSDRPSHQVDGEVRVFISSNSSYPDWLTSCPLIKLPHKAFQLFYGSIMMIASKSIFFFGGNCLKGYHDLAVPLPGRTYPSTHKSLAYFNRRLKKFRRIECSWASNANPMYFVFA